MVRALIVAGILTVTSTTAAAQERTTLRLATYVNKVDVRYSSLQYFATQARWDAVGDDPRTQPQKPFARK